MSSGPPAVTPPLSYPIQALRLVWGIAPGWLAGWGVALAGGGLVPVATVLLTRGLVDNLVIVAKSGPTGPIIHSSLVYIALMAGALVLGEMLRAGAQWARTGLMELVQDHISNLIQERSVSLDLAFYESPDYHDRLHRARADARQRPVALLESLGTTVENGTTLAAMTAVLVSFSPWLAVALVASTAPAAYVLLLHSRRFHEWRRRSTPDERRAWYYDGLVTSGQTAPEVRAFGLGDYFRLAHRALRDRLRREKMHLLTRETLAGLGVGIGGLLLAGAALGGMVWRGLTGAISLGDLTLVYQAFIQAQARLRAVVEGLRGIHSNSLGLGYLFEFLEMRGQIVDPDHPAAVPTRLRQGIRFRGVTFRYPGSDRTAIRDLSLTVPAGQIAAIVGPNGAGKSTFLKLLCRLYDPDAGSIELDGLDLRAMRLRDLRRLQTVLFQVPAAYSETARQNIALGDLEREVAHCEVEEAARLAGADAPIRRLPQGYETLLGKWFEGGAELSVGEWQRIGLARAFLRRAEIIILDEPTSAMDSWAEAEWLERFRLLVRGRTAIVITHRFTTAMKADVIHVMDEGHIIESGRHEELLAQGGRYAASWTAQVESWRVGPSEDTSPVPAPGAPPDSVHLCAVADEPAAIATQHAGRYRDKRNADC